MFSETPLLLIDNDAGQVRLISRADGLRRMNDATGFEVASLMDLQRALESFARIVGKDDRTFEIADIGKITALGTKGADFYIREGVVTPSVRPGDGPGRGKSRLFSWRDAFIAGVVGSLRRQNVGLASLRKVSRLLAAERVEA
jgi:hypothetical protein